MKKPKIHALLVGINDYKNIRSLSACEKDVERVEGYFNKYWSDSFELDILQLTTQNATKKNIIDAFKCHFNQVEADDLVLFYFSGHGGQEKASAAFHSSEANGLLQCIACYDSDIKTSTNFIADKELRYLIYPIAQTGAEVLTIFDCCHSGDNTRDLLSEYNERLTNKAPLKQRKWEDFIFAKSDANPNGFLESDFEGKPLDEILPQGDHFQLGACTSYQLALEHTDKQEGIFTAALLSVLNNSSHRLSYYELIKKVKVRLKQMYAVNQSPTIYFHSDDATVLFQKIFKGKEKLRYISKEVYYDETRRSWMIDLGGIHGVIEGNKGDEQVLVTNLEGDNLWAYVKKVYTNHSEIEFKPYSETAKVEIYTGYIGKLMSSDLKIYLAGKNDAVEILQKVYQNDNTYRTESGIDLVEKEEDADFTFFVADDSRCNLTKPFDHERPWIDRAYINTSKPIRFDSAENALNDLRLVSKWNFTKNLNNKYTSILPKAPFAIKVIQGEEVVPQENGSFYLNLNTTVSRDKPQGKVNIEFTNKSSANLHLAVMYLSTQMEIFCEILVPSVAYVEAGKTIEIREGKSLPFVWDNYLTNFNWEEDILRLKLIISTVPFEIQDFQQDAFKVPLKNGTYMGISTDELDEFPEWHLDDTWTTQYYEFRIKNPFL